MGSAKSHSHNQKNKYYDAYNSIKSSSLFHFDVPPAFINQTFEKMFEYLLKNHSILPIGLYRKAGFKDNLQPYVFTNPDPYTKMTKYDVIFILAEKQPPDDTNTWGTEVDEQLKSPNKNDQQKAMNEEAEINVHDEVEKDNLKIKGGQKDNEYIMSKISELVLDLNSLRREIDILKKVANERQNIIIEKIRSSIDLCLTELLSKFDSKNVDDNESSDISSCSNQST